ncbi:MAG: A24 family peptidase [Planctomycetota bacterium]
MHSNILIVRHILLFLLLVITVYTDLARGKIYNWATLPAIGLGVGVNFVLGGVFDGGMTGANLTSSLLAMALVALLFGWPYWRGGIAAGDVKFMLAVGALGGLHRLFTPYALLYSSLIGALMAVLVFIWRGELISGVGRAIRFTFSARRVDMMEKDNEAGEDHKLITIPYGCAIATGTIIAWYLVELPVD